MKNSIGVYIICSLIASVAYYVAAFSFSTFEPNYTFCCQLKELNKTMLRHLIYFVVSTSKNLPQQVGFDHHFCLFLNSTQMSLSLKCLFSKTLQLFPIKIVFLVAQYPALFLSLEPLRVPLTVQRKKGNFLVLGKYYLNM